jgi:type IV pilus assembly protein PilB
MNTSSTIALSGLARRLVKDGILAEQIAQEAFHSSTREKKPFVSYLVENNLADGYAIAEAASDEFGTPLFDLTAFNMTLTPKGLVDSKLVLKHHTVPLFRRGNRLFIAVSDPTNLRALDEIKFHTGINTDAVLVEERLLAQAVQKYLEAAEESMGTGLDGLDDASLESLDIESGDETAKEDDGPSGADEAPIVRFVNKILIDAIRGGSSDIHFEPYE